MNSSPILYAEDDEHDVFFLQHAFQAVGITNSLQIARDGQQAIDYLSRPNLPGSAVSFYRVSSCWT